MILIFAETTPKTFAAKNPEKIALPASATIELLIKLFRPFIWLVSYISQTILKPFGLKHASKDKLNSEELRMAVVDSKSIVSKNYQKMLLNIIDLEKVKVEDIMVPHNELVSVDINNEVELFDQLKRIQHTRLLIFEGSENNIIGTIHMRDVVNLYAKDEITIAAIKELIREPYFIPEGTPLSMQLEHFKNQKRKIKFLCLAGFMKILSKNFIENFGYKIINIHPSLLPKYKGLNTHKRVLKNNEKYTGCTVHFVTPELDSGQIILQKRILIDINETEESLKKKILQQEHKLYSQSIISIFR